MARRHIGLIPHIGLMRHQAERMVLGGRCRRLAQNGRGQ